MSKKVNLAIVQMTIRYKRAWIRDIFCIDLSLCIYEASLREYEAQAFGLYESATLPYEAMRTLPSP